MTSSLLICLLISPLLVPTGPLLPADPPDWEAAMKSSLSTLVDNQESMTKEKQKKLDPGQVAVREWPYEGVYREGGEIPPGYRVGGTAIVMRSLIEVPGIKKDKKRSESVLRGLSFLLDESLRAPRMGVGFRGGYDVRDWGHIESLETLLRMKELKLIPGKLRKRCHRLIGELVETLIATGKVQS